MAQIIFHIEMASKLFNSFRQRLHGVGRIFQKSYIRSVKTADQKRSLGQYVRKGPVSQVHDRHRVQMVPNLL